MDMGTFLLPETSWHWGTSSSAVPRGVPTCLCLVAHSGWRVDRVEQVVSVQH